MLLFRYLPNANDNGQTHLGMSCVAEEMKINAQTDSVVVTYARINKALGISLLLALL